MLLGPSVGGALCFAYQAVGVSRDPAGDADLASLFVALAVGTAAGAVVERVVRVAFPGRLEPPARVALTQTTPAVSAAPALTDTPE